MPQFVLQVQNINSRMLNRTRSFSSSSGISMENLASLRRSASDSLALMSSTNVIKIGVGDNFSFEGDVETRKGDDDNNNNNHLNYSSDKKPSSANNEVRALTPIDSSSKIDPQKSVASNDHGKGPKRMKRLDFFFLFCLLSVYTNFN